jgi:hypothetical protein
MNKPEFFNEVIGQLGKLLGKRPMAEKIHSPRIPITNQEVVSVEADGVSEGEDEFMKKVISILNTDARFKGPYTEKKMDEDILVISMMEQKRGKTVGAG